MCRFVKITAVPAVKVCSCSTSLHSSNVLDSLLQKWEEKILQQDLLYSHKDQFSAFKVKLVWFWFCVNKFLENWQNLWQDVILGWFVHLKECLSNERGFLKLEASH